MRRNIVLFLNLFVVGFFLISIFVPMNSAAGETLKIEGYLEYTVEDMFEYNLNIEDMLQKTVDENDLFTDYKDVKTSHKVTVTGSETIDFEGNSTDCWIVKRIARMEYTLEGDGVDIDYSVFDAVMTQKAWVKKVTHVLIKDEKELSLKMETFFGESGIYDTAVHESESVEVNTYTKVEAGPPFLLKVGKTWSNDNSYKTNTTSKTRYKYDESDFSDWEFDYDEEVISETINYEVLSQNEIVVPAGTFTTLKIKSQVKGEEEYTMIFMDKYGMTVERQEYEEGALVEISSLKSYTFESAKDSDGDGYIDIEDAFPFDANRHLDSDKDGVGDESDAFPYNASESKDTDGDGVGDNSDAFPNDKNETVDSDGDDVGDNSDAFPEDAAASKDTDKDGYPDEWNIGKSESDSTSALTLDEYPDNADKWKKESEDDNLLFYVIILVVVIVVVMLLLMASMKKKGPSEHAPPPPPKND